MGHFSPLLSPATSDRLESNPVLLTSPLSPDSSLDRISGSLLQGPSYPKWPLVTRLLGLEQVPTELNRHSRESGNPGPPAAAVALDPGLRGGDEE